MPGSRQYDVAFAEDIDAQIEALESQIRELQSQLDTLKAQKAQSDVGGDVTVVGRVENDTSEDDIYVYVQAMLYNAEGKIIGITGTNGRDIFPVARDRKNQHQKGL